MKDGRVKIYIGGESTNREKNFLDNIVKEDNTYVNKKKIIIAPENKLYYYENLILNLKKGINIDIELLSFSRMPYILFKKTRNRNNIYIDEIIKDIYLSKIIENEKKNNNLKVFNNDKIVNEMSNILSNIFENGIQRRQIEEYIQKEKTIDMLKIKMNDILTIYDKYVEKKIDKLDKEEVYQKILEDLESNTYFDDADIYILGFNSFKKVQLDILSKIISKSYNNGNIISISMVIDNIVSNNEMFNTTKKTLSNIITLCNGMNVEIVKPTSNYDSNVIDKFKKLDILKHMLDEKSIYECIQKQEGIERLKDNSIVIKSFEEKKDEIEYVAKDIYLNNYNIADIQIIMNDKDNYEHLLIDIFKKYGLNIQNNNKKKRNNLESHIINILKMITGNIYNIISIIKKSDILENRIFKENNINILDIYLLEKYLKRWNVYKNITQEFKYGKNSEKYENILRTQKVIIEYINDLKKRISGVNGYDISEKIFKYIEDEELVSKIYKKIGSKDKIVSEVINLNNILDRLSVLEECTLEEYIRYFEIIIEKENSYTVKSKEEISIITTDNVVNSNITYILSADEMNFPKVLERKELLTNNEKERLKEANIQILNLDEDIENKEEIETYLAVTSPKDKLILTYTNKDNEGKQILRKYLC